MNRQSSVVCYLTSVFSLLYPVICRLSSVFCFYAKQTQFTNCPNERKLIYNNELCNFYQSDESQKQSQFKPNTNLWRILEVEKNFKPDNLKKNNIYCIEPYSLFALTRVRLKKKRIPTLKTLTFKTIPKKYAVYPADGRNFCPHLTATTQRKPHKQPSTLIKEKIELRPIQPISCSIWGYDMTIGIIPLITTWLILAVLICWFAGGQTSIFGHQSIQQDGFPKKYHSPIQIRPPPLTACEFKSIFSTMYS